ncbi:hypothetical protein IAG44_26340 [Streptomyces roseirectus]|uniref:Uncharacterized protein n=1 Tax=Streptomyces roseirectus TaxID=2768066 RepID=A0A7H0III2_9ACTN|nr:hypothetical protein [Streptomyces roseirectus]QNP72598.1 hypothetical protein IAG44_26340 [Streptomyces roseirectus]
MEPGTLLYDPATVKVGEYQDHLGKYAMLRPVGGGTEWSADPKTLRPPTDSERVRAGVRAANRQSLNTPGNNCQLPPLEPAIDLNVPPRPYPNCATCDELATLRRAAAKEHDYSAATDANVLLRRHHAQAHPQRTTEDPAE